MKKPRNRGNKRPPQPPDIIRHYETLTPDETDEVVETVADMIVNFVQKRGLDSRVAKPGQSERAPGRIRRRPG